MNKWRIMWMVWLYSLISAWVGGILIVFIYNLLVMRLIDLRALVESMVFVVEIALWPVTLVSVGGTLWFFKKKCRISIAEGRKMGSILGGTAALLVYIPFGYHLFLRNVRIEVLLWNCLLVVGMGIFGGAINGMLLSITVKKKRRKSGNGG